jgi:hypothetical protein
MSVCRACRGTKLIPSKTLRSGPYSVVLYADEFGAHRQSPVYRDCTPLSIAESTRHHYAALREMCEREIESAWGRGFPCPKCCPEALQPLPDHLDQPV